MSKLQEKVNEVVDLLVYIQLMGSFIPGSNYNEIREIITSTNDFLRNSPEKEVKVKLPLVKKGLDNISNAYMQRFPLKKPLREVTVAFNEFFQNGTDVYQFGLEYGWLDEQMDLSNLSFYEDMPYQYKIGFGAHIGKGGIEEEFLLTDAFNVLVKAEDYFQLLAKYADHLKKMESQEGFQFGNDSYENITAIKYEIAAYSRLTVISFYAFVEAFVNSVGFNYLSRNRSSLSASEKEILNGTKKGRFLSLQSKLEKYQGIIRRDGKPVIKTTDSNQIIPPFKTFFDDYSDLRNASVHFSPSKEKIWLRPEDWLDKAMHFGHLSTEVALRFWQACYPGSMGPLYLGKLDFNLHMEKATKRIKTVSEIENLMQNNGK